MRSNTIKVITRFQYNSPDLKLITYTKANIAQRMM